MRKNFLYNEVIFAKHSLGERAAISGEITNRTGKDFNAVVFRISISVKYKPLGRITLTMNGFCNGQTKKFEKPIPELPYKNIPQITGWSIDAESSY